MTPKNIVILGAGFGGLRVAIELAKKRNSLKDYNIVLIDKNLHHAFTPLVYEVATGYFEHESWRGELALSRGAEITIPKIAEIACRDCVEFVAGEVVKIGTSAKKIMLRDGKEFEYEYLVLGVGSESDYFGIEGLREHAIPLKDVHDAAIIRKKITEFIHNKALRKSVQLQVMIGGGGATGVEFAAELAYYFKHIVHDKDLRSGDYEITLVEAASRLASFAPPDASKLVYDRLTKLGVKVLLDTCIKKVIDGEFIVTPRPLHPGESSDVLLCSIAPGDEKKLSYDLLVWAGGIRGSSLLQDSGFAVDTKGRIAVDDYYKVKDTENIFALGDCAAYIDTKSGKPTPWLAQTAIEQGYIVAAKILHEIIKSPARVYKSHAYPTVLPLGGKRALFVYKNFYMDGLLGWFIHEAASLRYFVSILGVKEGLKLWFRGAWVYSKND